MDCLAHVQSPVPHVQVTSGTTESEVIEFPFVVYDLDSKQVIDDKQIFVKPSKHPEINEDTSSKLPSSPCTSCKCVRMHVLSVVAGVGKFTSFSSCVVQMPRGLRTLCSSRRRTFRRACRCVVGRGGVLTGGGGESVSVMEHAAGM